MGWFPKDRSTGEILVLLVGITVCGYVVVIGGVTAFLAIAGHHGDALQAAGSNVVDVVNTLIGLLAGFLAGRTDLKSERKPPEGGQ